MTFLVFAQMPNFEQRELENTQRVGVLPWSMSLSACWMGNCCCTSIWGSRWKVQGEMWQGSKMGKHIIPYSSLPTKVGASLPRAKESSQESKGKVTALNVKEAVSDKYASAYVFPNDNGHAQFGDCSFNTLSTGGCTRIKGQGHSFEIKCSLVPETCHSTPI